MWKVGQHDNLVSLSDKLACVDGALVGAPIGRRMSICTLPGNDLAVINAIAVNESVLQQILARGRPRYLLIPNLLHTIDAPAWAERFPDLKVLAPSPALSALAKKVRIDGDLNELPPNPVLQAEIVAGTKGEALFTVNDGRETSLIVSDLIFNLGRLSGFQGFMLRLLGSTGEAKVTPLAKRTLVDDKKALRERLRELSDLQGLKRIIVSHGDIIDKAPSDTLRRIADAL